MFDQLVTGFTGDGTRELVEFACVMGFMVSVVVGWTWWYLRDG